MKYRKLRIAWSVAWGVVAVLLCVLWVRSYWRGDVLQFRSFPEDFGIGSAHGVIGADGNINPLKYISSPGWKLLSYPMFEDMTPPPFLCKYAPSVGFELNLPHWFLSLVFGMLTTLPWIRRFSLRTLLIATTLVAVGLGVVVWLGS
jgi:hypothetical protein